MRGWLKSVSCSDDEDVYFYGDEDSIVDIDKFEFNDVPGHVLIKPKEVFNVIEGANQKVTGNATTFRLNVASTYLQKVMINNEELIPDEDYIIEDEKIILTEKYTKKFGVGNYSLKVVYLYGEANTNFSVVDNPNTSDNIIFNLILLFISLLLSTFMIFRKHNDLIAF